MLSGLYSAFGAAMSVVDNSHDISADSFPSGVLNTKQGLKIQILADYLLGYVFQTWHIACRDIKQGKKE